MKRLFTLFIISAVSLTLTQCATKKAANKTASTSNVDPTVAEIKRNYNAAQIEEGRVIWQTSCGRCHKLYEPQTRTIATWEPVIARMIPKAKLDTEQGAKVRAYILTNAKM
jgi:cytochrome c5